MMPKKTAWGVQVIRKTSQQAKETDEFKNFDGFIEAPDFKSLERLFEESFLVPWVLEKIASSVWSKFITENEDLKTKLNWIDHDFLNMAREFFGITYFEIIRNKKGNEVKRLEPVITSTVRKLKKGWYAQKVWTKTVYFNEFIGNDDERNKQKKIWEATGVKPNELSTAKIPWYNPKLNELYEFKNANITSKNYGHSKFVSSIDQILLLSSIDVYFLNLFNNGWMKVSVISPKDAKTKLTVTWKKVLQTFLQNNMNGVPNAWTHALIDVAIEKTDLSDDVDTKAFNDKTEELLKKIAIGLNIPYEILLAVVWNKNTSTQALENFNNHKVLPIQWRNLKDFKKIFEWVEGIDDLEYEEIDLKDQLEEMKVVTWYVKHGTISQEQARERAWWDEPSDGDTFYTWTLTDDEDEIKVDEWETSPSESIEKIFKTIEKDVRENL